VPLSQPLTKKQGQGLVWLILIGMFVQCCVIGYVMYSSYSGRKDLVSFNRTACENRGRVANQANADFETAHTKYITKVIFDSPSVKADVKGHAREAVKTFNRTSAILTDLAHVNCRKAYPNASFFP
jgi:hypothetical protein